MTGDNATELARSAATGDPAALTRLIALTQRDVWRYIAFHAGRQDADDLTQDTYVRAIHSLPGFTGSSSVRTWLLVIARRVVIDHLRRLAVRPRTVSTDDWVQLADAGRRPGSSATDRVELDLLLAGLSADRRDALVLTQLLGLSYAEAGEVCGCPVGTIRSRVARAREDLVAAVTDEPANGRAASP